MFRGLLNKKQSLMAVTVCSKELNLAVMHTTPGVQQVQSHILGSPLTQKSSQSGLSQGSVRGFILSSALSGTASLKVGTDR